MNEHRSTIARRGRLGAILAAGVLAMMNLVGPTVAADIPNNAVMTAVAMAAPKEADASPIAVGGNHACALPGDGTVKCWGSNTSGQLGDGNTTGPSVLAPGVVPPSVTVIAAAGSNAPLTGVVAVTAGFAHTCARLVDTTVRCWGSNAGKPDLADPTATTTPPGGQLGDGTSTDSPAPVPVIKSAISPGVLSGVTAIAAGGDSTCALLAAGTMTCWGVGNLAPVMIRAAASGAQSLSGVVAIAVGDVSTCALLVDGTVSCWGAGNLTPTTIQSAPGSSSPLTGVIAITAEHGDDSFLTGTGHLHNAGPTCALLVDGTARCWGFNDGGQLGNGTTTDSQAPVAVVSSSGGGALTGVSAIAAGAAHACALLVGGTVRCWGLSSVDTLDAGLDVQTLVAGAGGADPLANASAIAAGGHQTCALLAGGSVECWGAVVDPPQLIPGLLIASPAVTPPPTATPTATSTGGSVATGATPKTGNATAIAAGPLHSCAITSTGGVKCWGSNNAFELGNGSSVPSSATPVDVVGLASGVTAIAAGHSFYTCALTGRGGVKCWGGNQSGQLGNGSTAYRSGPGDVVGLTSGVIAIAAGSAHACALTTGGGVKCWGSNNAGELGNGSQSPSLTPVDVVGLASGVTAIAAAANDTCALTSGGGVKCWGSNYSGELGIGSASPLISTSPVDVTGLSSGVTAVASYWDHICALTTLGGVKCWGSNRSGQLGNGSTTDANAPVDVSGLTSGVIAIAPGFDQTCALTSVGGVKCWGNNLYGELGNGSIVPSTTPVNVSGLTSGVREIVAGQFHACAVMSGGGVKCWGEDDWGQLGNGKPGCGGVSDCTTPVDVLLSSAVEPTPTPHPASFGADLQSGNWSVTYGSPSVVTISGTNGLYTVTAKSPTQVTGSSCYLPPGTLIATFSGSGGSYSGQHGLWHTSDCSFATWAPMTLTLAGTTLTGVVAGTTERPVFTRIGSAAPPFRESVPTPAQITLDPVIVAQSAAIAVGVVIFVPFPAILFNRTLEDNYPEIVGRVRRARRRLGVRRRLRAFLVLLLPRAGRGSQQPSAPSVLEPASSDPESVPESTRIDPEPEQKAGGEFWGTLPGIVFFLLLSALLYGFLDPAFGFDLPSAATFAGLVIGLVVTLLALCLPIALMYRRSAIPLSLRALPGTLGVGLACVLLTRLTDFHPGYLYGLVIAFVVAREVSVAVEGRAMAMATTGTLVVAVVAWFGLLWVDGLIPVDGEPAPGLIALQTALVMALVAGVELTVFGMVPLRFLPGERVFGWSRRAWAALLGIGMFGFAHVLMNPRSGYLADATRTPMFTIVALLLAFGLGSVVFWAYFRFRSAPAA